MSTSNFSGIYLDGTLKKFSAPIAVTAVSKAAASGDMNNLQKLSKKDLLAIDENGNTPLIWAADSGHVEALIYILDVLSEQSQDYQSCHINLRGYLGNTALGRAARGGHTECVSALVSHDFINPNICNEKMQYPLHFGAFKKHASVVDVLLKSGKCDTFVKDRKERTPAEDTSVQEIKNMIISYREEKAINS